MFVNRPYYLELPTSILRSIYVFGKHSMNKRTFCVHSFRRVQFLIGEMIMMTVSNTFLIISPSRINKCFSKMNERIFFHSQKRGV
jgi:hypothetical protein